MGSINEHLTIDEYIRYVENRASKRTIDVYKTIYKEVVAKWQTPDDWMESDVKKIYVYKNSSDSYWFIWSLCKGKKLPIEFIKSGGLCKNEEILKVYANNFDELEKAVRSLQNQYSCGVSKSIYSKLMKMCLYLGTNSVKNITYKALTQAFVDKLLDKNELYFLEELLRELGYLSIPPVRSKEWKVRIRNHKNSNVKDIWTNDVISHLNLQQLSHENQQQNYKEKHPLFVFRKRDVSFFTA